MGAHDETPPALPEESADFSRFLLRLKASIAMSERERVLHEKAAVHGRPTDATTARAASRLADAERGSMARAIAAPQAVEDADRKSVV